MRRSQRASQSSSQANYKEALKTDEDKESALATAASQLVVFVLHNLDNSKLLRRTVIQKHVSIKGVNWNKQFVAANKRLEEVYGCVLEVCDDPTVKQPSYYIKKLTPHIDLLYEDEEVKRKRIITFLVMAFVFMSNGKCSDTQLLQCFQKLNVFDEDEDGLRQHLKELHGKSLLEIDNNCISWGPLAEVVVSKMEILKFVSKVYNSRENSWGELHLKAVEQMELSKMDTNSQDVEENGAGSSS